MQRTVMFPDWLFQANYLLLVVDQFSDSYVRDRLRDTTDEKSIMRKVGAWGRSVDSWDAAADLVTTEHAGRTITARAALGLLRYAGKTSIGREKVASALAWLRSPYHWDSTIAGSGERPAGRGSPSEHAELLALNPRHTACVHHLLASRMRTLRSWTDLDEVRTGLPVLVAHVRREIGSFAERQSAFSWGASYILEALRELQHPIVWGRLAFSSDIRSRDKRALRRAESELINFLLGDLTWHQGWPLFVSELNLRTPEDDTRIIEPNSGVIGMTLELLARIPHFCRQYRRWDTQGRDIIAALVGIAERRGWTLPCYLGGEHSFASTLYLLQLLQRSRRCVGAQEALQRSTILLFGDAQTMERTYAISWGTLLLLTPDRQRATTREVEHLHSIARAITDRQHNNTRREWLSLPELDRIRGMPKGAAISLEHTLNRRVLRNRPFGETGSANPDVFICHAHEDKADVARPLADLLRRAGLAVWYDEYSLKVGDRMSERINHGLANARFGVVILSRRFFDKEWTKNELGALLAREAGGQKRILPVWHDLDAEYLNSKYPVLSDRYALRTADGLSEVADRLVGEVQRGRPNH
jgi:hypothetical protein